MQTRIKMDVWRGPVVFFVTCFTLMYFFTGNGFLTSLKIAGISAAAGLVVNFLGDKGSRKRRK